MDPHVSYILPQIFNRIDISFKHDWDTDAKRYLSFIRLLYTEFTNLEVGVVHIDQIISINTWYKGVFLSPAFPNIIILSLLGDATPSQQGFINECSPLINHYNIRLAKSDDIKCLVMFDVPLRLYYPIIDAFFRNDLFMRWPKPVEYKPPRRKEITYYLSPFYHDIFTIIYYKYIEYLKNAVWQEFHIKNPSSIHEKALEDISIDLQYEYNEYIRTCGIADDIVDFFKRAKIFNQLIEYRYLKLPYGLYNKLHFWIREKYVNEEVYVILEKHDNDTLQWFLKQTDTFKHFDVWHIGFCRNEYKKKRKRIKTFGYHDLSTNGQWYNSFPVIHTGDESIDRQLRSIVSTFIEDVYIN